MQRHNILIVDDDLMTQRLYEAYLKDPAFRILKAVSGKECFEQVRDNPVSLIILDIGIPDMDGYEIAAQLKLSKQSADIPIIFITSNTDSYFNAGKGYELGALDFLTKPVDAKSLGRKIMNLINGYEKNRLVQTDLEAARKTSRDLEERLQAVFSIFPHAIFVIDKSGCVTDCNTKAELFLLLKKREIVGRSFDTFLNKRCHEALGGALSKSFSSRVPQKCSCSIMRREVGEEIVTVIISTSGLIGLCEIDREPRSEVGYGQGK